MENGDFKSFSVDLSTLGSSDVIGSGQSQTTDVDPLRPLSVNPCLPRIDDNYDSQLDLTVRSRTSTSYYRPHPNNLSKYVECFPDRRLIVVRRCRGQGHGKPVVWSQRLQICVIVDSPIAQSVDDLASTSYESTSYETGTVALQSVDIEGAADTPFIDAQPLTSAANPCSSTAHAWLRPAVLYYPYPGDDTRFIQCASGSSGRAFVRRCPTGLRWNRRAMTCDRTISGGYSYQWPSRSD